MLLAVVIALVVVAAIAAFLVYRRFYAKKQVPFSATVLSAPKAGAAIPEGAGGAARNARLVDLDRGFRKAPVAGLETLTIASIQNTVHQQLEAAIARRQRFAATAAAAARERHGLEGNGGAAP